MIVHILVGLLPTHLHYEQASRYFTLEEYEVADANLKGQGNANRIGYYYCLYAKACCGIANATAVSVIAAKTLLKLHCGSFLRDSRQLFYICGASQQVLKL